MFAPEMDGSNAIVFSWGFANFQGIMFVVWSLTQVDISVDANQKSNCFTTILDGAKRGVYINSGRNWWYYRYPKNQPSDTHAMERFQLGFLGYILGGWYPPPPFPPLPIMRIKGAFWSATHVLFLVYSFTTPMFFFQSFLNILRNLAGPTERTP